MGAGGYIMDTEETTDKKIINCDHQKVMFIGENSLIGYYRCQACGEKIDPVEQAKNEGHLNVKLIDYYTQYPNRLNMMWRAHAFVRHLYNENLEPI